MELSSMNERLAYICLNFQLQNTIGSFKKHKSFSVHTSERELFKLNKQENTRKTVFVKQPTL